MNGKLHYAENKNAALRLPHFFLLLNFLLVLIHNRINFFYGK